MMLDESDITLVLNPKLRKYFEFDKNKQEIKLVDKYYWDEEKKKNVEWKLPDDLPEELKPFVKKVKKEEKKDDSDPEYHYFINCQKYFFEFVQEFHSILNSGDLQLPEGLSPLSTNFRKCQVCKNTSHVMTRFVRCRHDEDCQEHMKRLQNKDYEETCACNNYTSPCLSLSKIGIVLHLNFIDEEEGNLPLDVDVSPPSFPISQVKSQYNFMGPVPVPQFDGKIMDKRSNLEATRPYLWFAEWEKTEDMSDAAYEGDGLRRAVRLRNYNGVDVLAEQV